MTGPDSRTQYRSIIDDLVDECLRGQGTVLPSWVMRGDWPQEPEFNALLDRLTETERSLVARMLDDAYRGAVHMVLRVLGDAQVPPFDQSYEGEPYQDFVGRLGEDWEWPAEV